MGILCSANLISFGIGSLPLAAPLLPMSPVLQQCSLWRYLKVQLSIWSALKRVGALQLNPEDYCSRFFAGKDQKRAAKNGCLQVLGKTLSAVLSTTSNISADHKFGWWVASDLSDVLHNSAIRKISLFLPSFSCQQQSGRHSFIHPCSLWSSAARV